MANTPEVTKTTVTTAPEAPATKPKQKSKKKKMDAKNETKQFIHALKTHRYFIVSVAAMVLIILVLLRVITLNSMPVDQGYVDEGLSSLKAATFNDEVIQKMEALKESGARVPGSQDNPNRTNPFGE